MLTLLLGRDWTANRNVILSRIAEDVRNEKDGRILLVPELISHDTERRLSATAGDTASRFAQVLSFTRLGRRICDLVGNAAEENLDNGGRVVAMAAATKQLHSRLKAYAAVETKPEFLKELVDTVDEFKRCCISAEDLRWASARSEGSLAQKLEELSLILETYDAICAQGKRDPRSQMTWVLEQLEEMDFASRHTFYIDGFPDFTRQHMAVIAHLITHSESVVISLNCDSPDTQDPAFETAARTARELLRIAREKNVAVHMQIVPERVDSLSAMRKYLFRGEAKIKETQSVQLFRSSGIYQECQNAAEQIAQLVRSGARYRDFALVCTDIGTYYPMLRLAFKKNGIPLYLSGTEDILTSGVISTVLFALEAAMGGFEKKDVIRYLRSVLSPLTPEQADKMENYAVIWALSGQKWLQEWTMHPQGLSAIWDDTAKNTLAELNAMRNAAIAPVHTLQMSMRNAVCLREMVLAVYQFLEDVEFAHRLDLLAAELDAAGDNRSAQILNQLWDILLGALEQMHDVLGSTVWDADVFIRLLKLLLGCYDVGTIPSVLDAVTAGDVSSMRCQQQKFLLVLGADEGRMPGYAGAKGLLTDQERVFLRKLGVPLTGGSLDGLQAEFAEIYGVFCGAEQKVFVYSSGEQPSFVYKRLLAMGANETQLGARMLDWGCDPYGAGSVLTKHAMADAVTALGLQETFEDICLRREHDLGMVSAEGIRGIYGDKLVLSASQVDRQAECRLSYFLKYGLRAQERKEATVDPAEFGTYVHAVLEETAREVMQLGGFHRVDLQTTLDIAQKHSDQYAQDHFDQLDSTRLEYLFRRNMQELEMVVKELWRELHEAGYEPKYFELKFDRDGAMPAIEIPSADMPARLRGFVDRVDVWQHGGSTFFRVVDYKTGKKEFDYCDVFNGVGLQMLLYLFALEDAGEGVIPGTRVSAGVQYFPARVPYLNVDGSMSEEEAEANRLKQWKRSGLLLSNEDSLHAMDPSEKMNTLCCSKKKDGSISGDVADRVQMGQLKQHIMLVLQRMVKDIACGNVAPDPYTRGFSHNACSFCPYGLVCGKDHVEGRRNYKTMTAQRFWEELGKGDDHG